MQPDIYIRMYTTVIDI